MKYFESWCMEPTNHTIVVTYDVYMPKVKKWLEKLGVNCDNLPAIEPFWNAFCYQGEGVTVIVLREGNSIETIVHEVVHAVGHAWESAGASEEIVLSGEVMAYSISNTLRKVLDALDKIVTPAPAGNDIGEETNVNTNQESK